MEASRGIRFPRAPLKRDSTGNVRILIVGNSGAGKSTMAVRLAGILQLPTLHLDQLQFQPGWKKTPLDEFRNEVERFVHDNDSWIIDGDYRKFNDITASVATCILWLDPPFMLYFPRLVIRTILRLLRLTPQCRPGCSESLTEVLFGGEDSILVWSWSRHTPVRQYYLSKMHERGSDMEEKLIRLGGWGGEINAWLKQVENFAKM